MAGTRKVPKDSIRHFNHRAEWRQWLMANHDKKTEVWFVFPLVSSNEPSVSYNDAVEEALCFGWIDSTVKALNKHHKIQRFSPRGPRSGYSQANVERLHWLADEGMIMPDVLMKVTPMLEAPFVFPEDILKAIRSNRKAGRHYRELSEPYKRIRIAYIEAARNRPAEFQKRLNNFIEKTAEGKLIPGYGGIEKYY